MHKDIEQELSSPAPAAVLAAGIVAAMSFAIVFNTAWNQPDFALQSLRGMTERTHVIVAGKQGPLDRRAAAGLLVQVQQGLKALGYFSGTADGIDGELTRTAVRKYQARSGLPPTGKVSRELLERIRYNRQVVDAARFTTSEGPEPDQRVILVQTGLAELGYRPGAIDGFVGDGTRRAIREFEMDRGLPPTGEVSSRLLTEMKKIAGLSKLANP